MKKILLIAIIILSGCGPSAEEKAARLKEVGKHTIRPAYVEGIEEVIYKGCTYIVYNQSFDNAWGTHMGNCPNPIHKYNKVDSLEVQ